MASLRGYLPGTPVVGFYGMFEENFGSPQTPEPLSTVVPSSQGGRLLPFSCPCCDEAVDFGSPRVRECYHDVRKGLDEAGRRVRRDNYFCPHCGCRFKLDRTGIPLSTPIYGRVIAPSKVVDADGTVIVRNPLTILGGFMDRHRYAIGIVCGAVAPRRNASPSVPQRLAQAPRATFVSRGGAVASPSRMPFLNVAPGAVAPPTRGAPPVRGGGVAGGSSSGAAAVAAGQRAIAAGRRAMGKGFRRLGAAVVAAGQKAVAAGQKAFAPSAPSRLTRAIHAVVGDMSLSYEDASVAIARGLAAKAAEIAEAAVTMGGVLDALNQAWQTAKSSGQPPGAAEAADALYTEGQALKGRFDSMTIGPDLGSLGVEASGWINRAQALVGQIRAAQAPAADGGDGGGFGGGNGGGGGDGGGGGGDSGDGSDGGGFGGDGSTDGYEDESGVPTPPNYYGDDLMSDRSLSPPEIPDLMSEDPLPDDGGSFEEDNLDATDFSDGAQLEDVVGRAGRRHWSRHLHR